SKALRCRASVRASGTQSLHSAGYVSVNIAGRAPSSSHGSAANCHRIVRRLLSLHTVCTRPAAEGPALPAFVPPPRPVGKGVLSRIHSRRNRIARSATSTTYRFAIVHPPSAAPHRCAARFRLRCSGAVAASGARRRRSGYAVKPEQTVCLSRRHALARRADPQEPEANCNTNDTDVIRPTPNAHSRAGQGRSVPRLRLRYSRHERDASGALDRHTHTPHDLLAPAKPLAPAEPARRADSNNP